MRIGAAGRVEAAAHHHRDWIAREVLAVELDVVAGAPASADLEVDGVPVALEISRV